MKHLIEATPFEGEQDPKTLPNPQRMPPLPHNWVEPWDPSMQAEFRSGWKSFDFLIFGASIASLLTISSTFNSLFKVLCIFPSRYLCAIGLSPVFSFGWNLPPRIFGLHSQTTRLLESTTNLSAPRQEIAGKKGLPPPHPHSRRDCHPPWSPIPKELDLMAGAVCDVASQGYNSKELCPTSPRKGASRILRF